MSLRVLTSNSKTVVSLDFDRFKTCPQICSYCYVGNMERIYPAYKTKIQNNYERALQNPETFAAEVNSEYRKLRNSKAKTWKQLSKLPVRIYGSGDYIPQHFKMLSNLNFNFYIISKSLTLTTMQHQLSELLKLSNLTSIVLSFDATNRGNYAALQKYYGQNRIKFAYTGMPEDFKQVLLRGEKYNIFFNISDKKVEKENTRQFADRCPCDSGELAHAEACTKCNKCWRSSLTKNKGWNLLSEF